MESSTPRPASPPAPADAGGLPASTGFERLFRVLWRRKWIVVLSTTVVPLAALAFSLSQEKQYTATASLLFRDPAAAIIDPNANSQPTDPERDAATNNDLASLPVVAERTATLLRDIDVGAGEVSASVTVEPRESSNIAEISATTPSPELSARMANAYAAAYIEFRRSADRAKIRDAIELVQRNLDALPPDRRDGTEGRQLNARIDRLALAESLQTGNAELVQRATPPSSASSPQTSRNVFLGIVVGLLLGVGAALLFERLDRRFRSASDVEAGFDLPVLAQIPASRSLATRRRAPGELEPLVVEAFRTLRVNLRFFDVDRSLKSIAIVSPLPGDGKSTVARDLARTMAGLGDRVVLLETDLHKGSSAADADDRGLSSVLAGHIGVWDAIITLSLSGPVESTASVALLPAGIPPPNPARLLDSDRMREVLRELEDSFDHVIIDTPALGVVSDAMSLLRRVNGVVLVARVGRTTRDSAAKILRQLEMAGVEPLGLVINMVPADRGSRGGYGYYGRSSRHTAAPRQQGAAGPPSLDKGQPVAQDDDEPTSAVSGSVPPPSA